MPPVPVKNVIVCGFSYSGSSAVIDLLRDHPGVKKFPGGEYRFLRASWGANRLLRALMKGPREELPAAIARFGAFCRGEMPELRKTDGRCNRFVAAVRKRMGGWFDWLAEDTCARLRAAAALTDDEACREAALRALRAFFFHLSERVAGAGTTSHLLLDQAVRPWTLHDAVCFEPCHIIIVRRDARDQFVDQFNKAGLPERDVRAFMRQVGRRYAAIDRKVRALTGISGHRVLDLQFETLVLDSEAETARIRDFLGIETRPDPAARKRFDPAQSAGNLRIFGEHPQADDIAFIETKYRGLLFAGAAPRG